MTAKTDGETPKRMQCWNCPRYNREERRCADGKANPKKKADSVTVAEVLGLRALCHYNPYRDGLAARMYFPHTPLGIHSVPPRRPRQRKYGNLTLPEPEVAQEGEKVDVEADPCLPEQKTEENATINRQSTIVYPDREGTSPPC